MACLPRTASSPEQRKLEGSRGPRFLPEAWPALSPRVSLSRLLLCFRGKAEGSLLLYFRSKAVARLANVLICPFIPLRPRHPFLPTMESNRQWSLIKADQTGLPFSLMQMPDLKTEHLPSRSHEVRFMARTPASRDVLSTWITCIFWHTCGAPVLSQ